MYPWRWHFRCDGAFAAYTTLILILCFFLQKNSPYIDDANKLIDLGRQLGLDETGLQKYLPNATQCYHWNAIQESHSAKDENVVFKIEDIYGIILLLVIGLCGAILVAMVEYIFFKNTVKKADPDGTSSMEQHSRNFNQNYLITTTIEA